MFKKVDPKQSFPKMEEEILKFWEENNIFEKSVEKEAPAGDFIFYEGPPTANGVPGLHHVLARAFKDIIPRYKTMKGFRVERKAGWDTHGLPVEIQVEKELGLKSKQEIESIVPSNPRESIIEFNKKCKESVWKYKDLWEKMTRRMAYWVDIKNPYITYENQYMESVWWVFAQIFKSKNEKGERLVYKGHKVVPYCYRCGTALSSHEVAQGYQKVKDNSTFVKFKLKPNQSIIPLAEDKKEHPLGDNTYLITWTTTPWTLPGNVALAINPNITYVLVSNNKIVGEKYIIANDKYEEIFGVSEDYIKSYLFDGRRLLFDIENKHLQIEYFPLYETNNTDKKAHYVVTGNFVTTQEGTGIVHIAPAFGEDDSNVGRENDLPTLLTVDAEGRMSVDVPGKGILVKKKNDKGEYTVDQLIIDDLRNRKLLFKEEKYEHDYPFCWRCDTPLIYYAKPSWFIRMSELPADLTRNNEKINWIPDYIKEGRFGEWLRGVKDWAISRERYWGTPLPIWECEKCGETRVIESIKELESLSGQKFEDLHKPFIDDAKFKCACGGEMIRTSEVMDVWFDSGSMPLAQFSYPNGATKEDKQKIESGKFFPADYISEAIDQTRGWFYTLHAIATLLNKTGKVPTGHAFKNVICLGHVLDAKGKKMSKSKGNIIEPMQVMNEFGADMLRWMLFTINQPGLPKKFDIKGMRDIMNRVFRMLWNSYFFFVMYANIDKWQPKREWRSDNLMDKWIISELNMLIVEVNEKLNSYDIYSPAKSIEKFIDNLSNWYIRRSRKRFWKSEDDADKNSAYQTLHTVLVELSKLMAPFTPFVAEEIYKNLTATGQASKASVHLAEFSEADEKMIDEKLNREMENARNIISEALQLRAKAGIKVRQPLSELRVTSYELREEFVDIIKEEVNVKKAMVEKEGESKIELNTEITKELKLEGQAREIVRLIQEMRKEAGYEVDNRIKVRYLGASEAFEKFGELIAKETLATELERGQMEEFDLEKEISIEEEKIKIQIRRQK